MTVDNLVVTNSGTRAAAIIAATLIIYEVVYDESGKEDNGLIRCSADRSMGIIAAQLSNNIEPVVIKAGDIVTIQLHVPVDKDADVSESAGNAVVDFKKARVRHKEPVFVTCLVIRVATPDTVAGKVIQIGKMACR